MLPQSVTIVSVEGPTPVTIYPTKTRKFYYSSPLVPPISSLLYYICTYPMQSADTSPEAQVVFSSDVKNMDEWAKRTGIPLTTAEALGETYARAHRWLLALSSQLVQHYNWKDSRSTDRRLLFSLDTPSIWRSSSGLPASPSLRLQLPVHAGSFFSPDRRVQWEMVFHSDIFQTNRKLCAPISDILHLIQCLLTGVLTLVFDENMPEGIYRTTRGLPSVAWINANEAALVEVFGAAHFKNLWRACSNTKTSYKLEVVPHQR